MSTKRLMNVLVSVGVLSFFAIFAYGVTKGNMKVEITEDRVVVSCVDGNNPILRTVPRPRGGYYAVVVCEIK